MTAKMTAAGRACESERPDRLFNDPLARALAGEEGFQWTEEMRVPSTPAYNVENTTTSSETWTGVSYALSNQTPCWHPTS
jgi:O-methyltransferase involved in polyketide biosynthesis